MTLSYTVKKSNFNEIQPVWTNHLWPGRQSEIEAISCIDEQGVINLSLKGSQPYFWKVESPAGELVGVLSGHGTSETHFRSRGLWVHENNRGQGLAQKLMQRLVQDAGEMGFQTIWTMPRVTSWGFYKKFGFEKKTFLDQYEFGPHYLADYKLGDFKWN